MASYGVARSNDLLAKPCAPMPVARPELPTAEALLPYLRRLDETRWYSNFGPLLTEFEARLADRFGPQTHVVTCANATQGLTLCLQAMDLPQGSLCALPAYTFVATAHAVIAAGLVPYFLDVDPDTWMLQPQTVRDALQGAPGPISAAILVAPFGLMPDLAPWLALREETGLQVLLDAAAAFDDLQAAPVPAVVSLHATKVLGIGEGGFLATTDDILAQRVRQRTTYGFRGSRESHIPATNAKLSEYAGAVGLAALDGWPHNRLRWLRTAQAVRAALLHLPQVGFQPGWGANWVTSVCSVRLPDGAAAAVEEKLNARGVETRRWWGLGCHTNPAFAGCPHGDLTETDRLGASVIGLPFAIDLDFEQIGAVASALAESLDALGPPPPPEGS
ncbi:MAG: DegT/DnrJ/EryC1/StrS family aminotransferase [Phenylobacterium sp.]|uniref:DegT/DnrJ/EryC1/StrS family aminotransferase n=2 Tax=Phenylobacterium sp. TaxID=1871053 RepID=UPI00185BA3A3|nr:aminotransferase class I/II-fold pyridoxal phosphate-dependent enzyme [Phenylobacterium sp.]MBA4792213.1 DegT/DnrJ/EryC1/StrS family aminotransferase [Phenylobacterium sp.]